MSVIYLVRHAQASFGTENYDRLSPTGLAQADILGEHFADRGIAPDRLIAGQMLRQRQTLSGLAAKGGLDRDQLTHTGWDEFSASNITAAYPEQDPLAKTDTRAFQRLLEKSSARWASGDHDADYTETFNEFTSRVENALKDAMSSLGKGESAAVVSSSGAIAWTAAHLLGGGFDLWLRLNRVTVNTGVTKIVGGAQGITLVSFNDHSHLANDMVTYR